MDPLLCEFKLIPDPNLKNQKKFGDLEAQNGAAEGRGRSKWRRAGGSVGQSSQIRIILMMSRIRIRIRL
jgi:hypothetical protein